MRCENCGEVIEGAPYEVFDQQGEMHLICGPCFGGDEFENENDYEIDGQWVENYYNRYGR